MPRGIAPPSCQELEAVAEPGEQRGRRQELGPRSGELDRERQPVEPGAELCDGGRVLLAQLEVRIRGLCAADEQLGRLVVRERRHREFPLGRHVQRRSTRDDDLHLRCGFQERRDRARGGEDLLEVVHEQQ